jgi:hypothetical protein
VPERKWYWIGSPERSEHAYTTAENSPLQPPLPDKVLVDGLRRYDKKTTSGQRDDSCVLWEAVTSRSEIKLTPEKGPWCIVVACEIVAAGSSSTKYWVWLYDREDGVVCRMPSSLLWTSRLLEKALSPEEVKLVAKKMNEPLLRHTRPSAAAGSKGTSGSRDLADDLYQPEEPTEEEAPQSPRQTRSATRRAGGSSSGRKRKREEGEGAGHSGRKAAKTARGMGKRRQQEHSAESENVSLAINCPRQIVVCAG